MPRVCPRYLLILSFLNIPINERVSQLLCLHHILTVGAIGHSIYESGFWVLRVVAIHSIWVVSRIASSLQNRCLTRRNDRIKRWPISRCLPCKLQEIPLSQRYRQHVKSLYVPIPTSLSSAWSRSTSSPKHKCPLRPLTLSILPPAKDEKITAFGYASTSAVTEEGQQVKFCLNPSTSIGIVTEVYPGLGDRALLSFPSFQVKTQFIGGMSGGPIFSGYDDDPIAYGVVLWPMAGIRIDHNIPGVISKGPYTILELARAGLMSVNDWDCVEANVELFEEADGKRRIRLRISP